MKKFSEISINEELFGIFKSKPKENQKIKVSKKLIEFYATSLINGDFCSLHEQERKKFDFELYKVISIERSGDDSFIIEIETFDKMRQSLGNLEYEMTI